jgi:hypothetical protein
METSVFRLLEQTDLGIGLLAVAFFLGAFWALRGSPLGQAVAPELDEAAPRSGHRDRMVAGMAAGLLLVVLGAYVAVSRSLVWSIPLFGAGLGLVLGLVAYNRRYRHASPSLRRSMELTTAVLNGGLLVGFLITLNVIAFRYGGSVIDMTREQTFSLSSLTLNQVQSLRRPVVFHLVFGQGPRGARMTDRVAQLLELYRLANPAMIRIDSINPYSDLARVEDLTRKVPDLAVLQGGGVLIEYGEAADAEYVLVSTQEMFEPISPGRLAAGSDRFETTFKGEDAITSALIRLRDARKPKVAFTTGHGEASTTDLSPSGSSVGLFRARLASTGCEVLELNLLRDEIPEDLALLIIVAPRDDFKPEELSSLQRYAERGGAALVMVGNVDSSDLGPFLRWFNLELGSGLVIDPQLNFNRNVQLVFAFLKGGPSHPIVDALTPDRAILVPNGAPIHILGQAAPGRPPTAPVHPNLVPVPILRTGPQSWAETDLNNPRPRFEQDLDLPGPVTVGVAVEERPPGGRTGGSVGETSNKPRLVLFSSKSIAENIVHGIEPTNLDLVMNAASWLRGRSDALGIAPKTHVALTLTADPVLRVRLVLIPTVVAVLSILAAGLIVHATRRF